VSFRAENPRLPTGIFNRDHTKNPLIENTLDKKEKDTDAQKERLILPSGKGDLTCEAAINNMFLLRELYS
jgi:hypothetical protein